MRILEIILIALSFLGVMLSYSLVTGGNLLTVAAFTCLIFFYLIFGFALFNGFSLIDLFRKKAYQSTSAMRFLGAVCFGFTLFILVNGIFFKIMLWPGSSIIILVGFFALIVSIIVASVRYNKTRDSSFYKGIFIRAFIVAVIGGAAFLTPGMTLLKLKYGDYPDYIEAVKAVDRDPNNIELLRKKKAAYHKMVNEIHGVKANKK